MRFISFNFLPFLWCYPLHVLSSEWQHKSMERQLTFGIGGLVAINTWSNRAAKASISGATGNPDSCRSHTSKSKSRDTCRFVDWLDTQHVDYSKWFNDYLSQLPETLESACIPSLDLLHLKDYSLTSRAYTVIFHHLFFRFFRCVMRLHHRREWHWAVRLVVPSFPHIRPIVLLWWDT